CALSCRPADPLAALAAPKPHVHDAVLLRLADLDVRCAPLAQRGVAPFRVGDVDGADDDRGNTDRAIRMIGRRTAGYAELARREVLDDEWKRRLEHSGAPLELDPIGGDAAALFWRSLHERSEEHTSELQSLAYLVCRLLLEKKK